jgi:hypothetical protein
MISQGEQCHHNTVDAEALLQFTLQTIVTCVKRGGGAEKLRAAIEARARAAGSQPQTPEEAMHAEIRDQAAKLRRQVEQAPRRILEAEDEDVRAMLHTALRDLRAELAERERALVEVAARLPVRPEQMDVESEVQKALALLEQVETICADPVAREDMPRLLNDLGVRIGLTFRDGTFNSRRVRKPESPGWIERIEFPVAGRQGGFIGRFRNPSPTARGTTVIQGKSGRLDSNQRPLRPERSALARLSYAPIWIGFGWTERQTSTVPARDS